MGLGWGSPYADSFHHSFTQSMRNPEPDAVGSGVGPPSGTDTSTRTR